LQKTLPAIPSSRHAAADGLGYGDAHNLAGVQPMSEKKEDPAFAKAISYCDKATMSGRVEDLALGLKFFIEGMKRRQTQPTNSLFSMAIDHCERAATPKELNWQYRLGHVATALQQFIAAMK
jgi:hypothetical protein